MERVPDRHAVADPLSRPAEDKTLTQPSQLVAPPYETQLDQNPRWALSEGSRHFEGKSASSTPSTRSRDA